MKKIIILYSFLLLCMGGAYAQIDTEFWFAFPDLSADHAQTCVSLNVITFDEAATIRIEQPANPNFSVISRTVAAQSSYRFNMGGADIFPMVETIHGGVRNAGFLITSTAPISLYYANTCDNSEIYSLKGSNALGTDFIVPMQYEYANSERYGGWASVEFVATEDGTEVKFTPTQNCVGHTKGVEATIKLDRGQSYAIRASSRDAAKHFYNTPITSNKPIAVNYTDDSVAGPGVDLIGDQLVPLNLVGRQYIAVRNTIDDNTVDKVYLFPTANNTDVYINGDKKVTLDMTTNNKYMYDLYKNNDEVIFIDATEPVVVLHITSKKPGANSDPELGASVLPNIECSGSTEVAYKPIENGGSPAVSIVTRKENIAQFSHGHLAFPQLYKPVPGTNDEWYYVLRNLTADGAQPIRIKSTNGGVFHMGVYDSPGNTCSYGYFSSYNAHPVGMLTDKTHYVVGDVIELSVPNLSNLSSVSYTDPQGNVHTVTNPQSNPVFVINATDASYAGQYIIDGSSKYGCQIEPEELYITVFEEPVAKEVDMCLGNSEELRAEGYGPYEWTPSGLSNEQTAVVTPTKGDTTYIYTVRNYKPGINMVQNGDFQDPSNITFTSDYTPISPNGSLTSPGYVIGNNPMLYNSAYVSKTDHTMGDILPSLGQQMIIHCQDGESLLWEQTVRGLVFGTQYKFSVWLLNANEKAEPVRIKYKVNGLYAQERDSEGNLIYDSGNNAIDVAEYEIPADGEWHELSYAFKEDISSATVGIYAVNTRAGSAVSLDDITLSPLYDIVDTFHVNVTDSLKPVLSNPPYICDGVATLSLEEEYDSYQWSNGATTASTTVTVAGDYSVEVTRGDCERGTLFFTVEPSPPVTITLEEDPLICAGEPSFELSYTEDSGEIGTYSVVFEEKALNAGFQNINVRAVEEGKLVIDLPVHVRPDHYSAELTVFQNGCNTVGTINPSPTLEFTVQYNSDLVIAQRWNDVLSVRNSTYNNGEGNEGFEFTAYQWYKNGEKLEGETRPYYKSPVNFETDDYYSVELTRGDQTSISTCAFVPEVLDGPFLEEPSTPSLVSRSQVFSLEDVKSAGSARIWSMTGRLMSSQLVDEGQAEVKAPDEAGVYILELTDGETNTKSKIIVK